MPLKATDVQEDGSMEDENLQRQIRHEETFNELLN
jgi:hypothetical protein